MDTPVKSHSTTTPFSSQFEDSPVFNYISNLSPIEPVKSGHSNHTLNSLNFASPPSVFTSPQISSFSETRFSLRRHNLLDSSKTESSQSEIENAIKTTEGVSLASQSEQLGHLNSGNSAREVNDEQPTENFELAVEFPGTLKYDCGSPDDNPVPLSVVHRDVMLEAGETGASLVQSVTDDSKVGHCLFEREKDLRKISRVEQSKDLEGCDWVNVISDSNNLLRLDLPITKDHSEEQELGMVDSGTISLVSNVLEDNSNHNDRGKTVCIFPTGSSEQLGMKAPGIQPEGIVGVKETDQTPAMLSSTLLNQLVVSNSSDLVDGKSQKYINSSTTPSSQLHRTIRRRSLVFERAESHKRKSICDSIQSNNKAATSDDKLALSGYSFSKLPGIGLHLNTLASTNDGLVSNENWASESQLISTPRIMKPCSLALPEVPPDNLERALVPWDGETQVTETTYQTSEYLVGEELKHTSPRNKRHVRNTLCKSEQVGEDLACKRCNCKRSKCLKLYCECFAAGLYCVEPCSCQDCLNKPIHENIVLETRKQIESRNPLAFAPKVIRSVDAVSEYGGGVGCSMGCRCVGCKNTFGQKDGDIGTEETEFKEPKLETYQKHAHDVSLEMAKDQDLPITPSEIGRPSNQQQLNFSRKPRTSLYSIGSSPQLGNRENREKISFESHLQMIPEDGTLETLESSCPQTSGVKSTSPNSKRVSPPYREFGSLTARRSGRKLILRSIPAFPQLSSHHDSDGFPEEHSQF
ncbi:hypothetical protein L484_006166 [Morus notabilis]|uniref:CRC domain-containing protein n=1 Tax=Morus notabilis TaxID=981085 RepID=W9R6Q7_9ROSA|nr:hypothetical protein L484_006166 [Morus notabilis]